MLEVFALVAVVAVHAVGVDHEVEVLAGFVKGVEELEGILMVNVVVTGAVSEFEHDRFLGFARNDGHRIAVDIVQDF